jgi:hypothetical protein
VRIGAGMYHNDYLSENSNLLDYGKPNSNQNDNVKKACSEFVRFVFYRAGIPSYNPGVGFVEQVNKMANISQNDALNNNKLSDYYFIRHLDHFNLPRSKNYWAVSPASIMNDPKLQVAFTTRSFGGEYSSEKEIANYLSINEPSLPHPKESPVNNWPSYFVQNTYEAERVSLPEIPASETPSHPICKFTVSKSNSVGKVKVTWECSSNTRQLSGDCKLPNGKLLSLEIGELNGQADVQEGTLCDLIALNFNLSTSVSVPYHILFSLSHEAHSTSLPSCTNVAQTPVSCAIYAGRYGIPVNATKGNASWTKNSCSGAIKYTGGCYNGARNYDSPNVITR